VASFVRLLCLHSEISEMAGKSVFALVLALATVSVHASVCPAGRKPKTSTSYCATSSCTTADGSTCCALDTTKCGGITAVQCDANMYWDTAKAGTTITTPVTDATKKSSCCTSQGTCTGYSSCPAGKKLKGTPGSFYCATSSCTTTDADTCCELDTAKCGGITPPTSTSAYKCDANMYWDSAKAGTTITTPVTDATKKSSCCTSQGTCTGYSSCPAGKKLKGTPGSIYCATSSCTTTDAATCCEADTDKCGGITAVQCDANMYWDTAKADTTITTPVADATKKSSCCTSQGTCTGYSSCPAGMKIKGTPGSIYCATSSCTTGESATCCEADSDKCGGITAVQCDANMYWDTAKADTTITTPVADATKKSSCCTSQMTCDFSEGPVAGASKSETMLALTLAMFSVTALIS